MNRTAVNRVYVCEMPRADRYDLVILGGGTGGLISASIAAGVGARVALIERSRTGGDCLWTGCVPSKALLAVAEIAHRMRHADAIGLPALEPKIDFAAVMGHVAAAQAVIAPTDSPERLRREGVEVIQATGAFVAPGVVSAAGRQLRCRTAIIATGSRPVLPRIDGLADAEPLTTDTVWELRELPQRLLVLGGGPVGCELGQAFARLGATVTLVEMTPRLLPREEPRASAVIAEVLGDDGVEVHLGARVVAIESTGAERHVVLDDGDRGRESVACDRVLVAAGREPVTDGLGLETIGVRSDEHGAVVVDERLASTATGVYAVGDVTGALPFTHVAAYQARVATPNALFGLHRKASYRAIPWVTFTDPEVGRVGLAEQQARARWGRRTVVAEFDYDRLDRAIISGRTRGFAKLIGDPRGRLVGATVVADSGGELIAALAARVAAGDRIDDISRQTHAYPTLAEGPARAADTRVVARYSSRRWRMLTRLVLGALRAGGRR